MIINRIYKIQNFLTLQFVSFLVGLRTYQHPCLYRGADKSLARPTSRCILFDGENISFDAILVIYIYIVLIFLLEPGVAQWLRRCATSRTVPESIRGGVTGDFSVVPPTEPCALSSTQPLKESTRDFSWGKGCRCVWLTTYHPCSAETSRKSGILIYPEPLGPPRPLAGHLYLLIFLHL